MIAGSFPSFVRPEPKSMSRLVELHRAIRQLAAVAPNTFSSPEIVRSLEQELMHAIMCCLARQEHTHVGSQHHSMIVKRFEDFLATHCNKPLYLAEICTA